MGIIILKERRKGKFCLQMLSKYKQLDMCISCRIWKQDIVHSAHSSKLMDDIHRPEGEKSDKTIHLFYFPLVSLIIFASISSILSPLLYLDFQILKNSFQRTKQGFLFFPTVRIDLWFSLSFLGAQDVTVEMRTKIQVCEMSELARSFNRYVKMRVWFFFYVHFKYLFLNCIYWFSHFTRATLQ